MLLQANEDLNINDDNNPEDVRQTVALTEKRLRFNPKDFQLLTFSYANGTITPKQACADQISQRKLLVLVSCTAMRCFKHRHVPPLQMVWAIKQVTQPAEECDFGDRFHIDPGAKKWQEALAENFGLLRVRCRILSCLKGKNIAPLIQAFGFYYCTSIAAAIPLSQVNN